MLLNQQLVASVYHEEQHYSTMISTHFIVIWIHILAVSDVFSMPRPPQCETITPGNVSLSTLSPNSMARDICLEPGTDNFYIRVLFTSLEFTMGGKIDIYEQCNPMGRNYDRSEMIGESATASMLVIGKQNCPMWIRLTPKSECSFDYEYTQDCPVLSGALPVLLTRRHGSSNCAEIRGMDNHFINVSVSNSEGSAHLTINEVASDGDVQATSKHRMTGTFSSNTPGTSLRLFLAGQGNSRSSADISFIFRAVPDHITCRPNPSTNTSVSSTTSQSMTSDHSRSPSETPPVSSGDGSPTPTVQFPGKSSGQQSGPPSAVWVVSVLVGALLLVAVVVVLMRYWRKHTYVHRGDSEKKIVSDARHGVQSVPDGPVHLSGNDVVYNPAYQSSRDITETKIEGAVYNTAYQSAEYVGNTASDPTPAPRKPTYGYAYAHARTNPSDQGRVWNKRDQANKPVHPRKEHTYAEQMKKPNMKSTHEYAYADTENAMPSSANSENQKGQVYNVAYQSVDAPGVPGTGKKNGDAYCYVASPRPTAPLVTDAMEFTGDADYSYATPDGAAPSSKRGNMDVGEAYNVADQSVGNQPLENPGTAPEYMTVLD